MIILTAKDKIINHGRDFLPSITDHQMITGRIGSTQGANTVNTHAIKDKRYKDIFLVTTKRQI